MRVVAAIPAAGLLAGAAAGLVFPDFPATPSYAVLILCAALAWWAWRTARAQLLAAVVVVAFCIGGALLAADAWQRAWRPPLRLAFEELARQGREQAAREGRRLPEDDEAFAIVEGVLRVDAAPGESGAAPPGIEFSVLQRAQARALLEVLLAEAIAENRARQREVSHDENNR